MVMVQTASRSRNLCPNSPTVRFISNLELLLEAIAENKLDTTIIKQLLRKVEIELDLFGIDIAFSGCTLIGVVIHDNLVYCINVGDSKAILCQGLAITEISTPHKPDNPI